MFKEFKYSDQHSYNDVNLPQTKNQNQIKDQRK